jgi:hypothetical protein
MIPFEFVPEPDAEPHELAPGLAIMLPARATSRAPVLLGGTPCNVTMRLAWMPDDTIKPTSITVEAANGTDPIDGTVLRGARVRELVQHAANPGLTRYEAEPTPDGGVSITILSTDLDEKDRELIRLRGPVDSSLEWVAFVFNAAVALGVPPVQQVMQELGLTRSTANKWIARCRAQGKITSPERDHDGQH